MTIRCGELFAGYGGLGMGVLDALGGGDVVWHSEYEPPSRAVPRPTQAAARILAHRYPGVPNHGDITTIDWSSVAPVHVLTGGFPCQDLSLAGLREGMRPSTRSGLWTQMAYAIAQLRPRLVVAENVRGLLSAHADSDLEPCPWCVGDEPGVPLRALGAVLGDLADLGYDAAWTSLRAADVGAPHGRFRVFVAAWPAADAEGVARRGGHGDDVRARRGAVDGGPDAGRGAAGDAALRAGAAEPAAGGRRDSGPARPVGGPDGDAAEDPDVAAGGERRLAAPGQAPLRRARPDAGRRGGVLATDADGGGREGIGRGRISPGRAAGDAARDRTGGAAAADADGPGPQGHRRLHPTPREGEAGPLDCGPAADADGAAAARLADAPQRQPVGGAAAGRRGTGSFSGRAAADAAGERRDEGRPEPARLERGPDASLGGAAAPAAPDRGAAAADPGGDRRDRHPQPDGEPPTGLDSSSRGHPDRRAGAAGPAPIRPDEAPNYEWGPYAVAVTRWERVTGRPAPAPTELTAKGGQRLSPAFVEWMMGLPPGWVTAVPGITRNEQLKALGNGVVPQQAAAALTQLIRTGAIPHAVIDALLHPATDDEARA